MEDLSLKFPELIYSGCPVTLKENIAKQGTQPWPWLAACVSLSPDLHLDSRQARDHTDHCQWFSWIWQRVWSVHLCMWLLEFLHFSEYWTVWWLTLCVTLMGSWGTPRFFSKQLFLGVFPDETSIWVGLSETIALPSEGLNRTKKCGRRESLLSAWLSELGHRSPALRVRLRPSAPLVLRPLDSDWTIPLAFPALQLAESVYWDF